MIEVCVCLFSALVQLLQRLLELVSLGILYQFQGEVRGVVFEVSEGLEVPNESLILLLASHLFLKGHLFGLYFPLQRLPQNLLVHFLEVILLRQLGLFVVLNHEVDLSKAFLRQSPPGLELVRQKTEFFNLIILVLDHALLVVGPSPLVLPLVEYVEEVVFDLESLIKVLEVPNIKVLHCKLVVALNFEELFL